MRKTYLVVLSLIVAFLIGVFGLSRNFPAAHADPLPTANLSASPTVVSSGKAPVMTWNSSNAQMCRVVAPIGGGFRVNGLTGGATDNQTSLGGGAHAPNPITTDTTFAIRCFTKQYNSEKGYYDNLTVTGSDGLSGYANADPTDHYAEAQVKVTVSTGGGGGCVGGFGCPNPGPASGADTNTGSGGSTGSWSGGGVQASDLISYLSPSGKLEYVKTIAKRYADISTVGIHQLDTDNVFGGSGIFPQNFSTAKLGGKQYLYLAADGDILVYDISDPGNPIQVQDFNIATTIASYPNPDPFIIKSGSLKGTPANPYICRPWIDHTHGGFAAARQIDTLDNFDYALVRIQPTGNGGLDPNGFAIMGIDPSSGQLFAKEEWTFCYDSYAWGLFKGSDGKAYFLSSNYGIVNVMNVISSGKLTSSGKLPTGTAWNSSGVFTVNGKTYSMAYAGTGRNYAIYDISDPTSVKKVLDNVALPYGTSAFDEQTGYFYTFAEDGSGTINIYSFNHLSDASPSFPLVKTYQLSRDILKLKESYVDPISQYIHQNSSDVIIGTIDGKTVDDNWGPYLLGGTVFKVSGGIATFSVGGLSFNTNDPTRGIMDPEGLIPAKYGNYVDKLLYPQFVVSFTDINSPALLGIITARRSITDAFSYSVGYEDQHYNDTAVVGSYLYRANQRRADVWNIGASGGVPPSSPPTTTIGNPITPLSQTQAIPFSFQSLLNIFRRIFNK